MSLWTKSCSDGDYKMKLLWKYVHMVLLPFMHFTRRNLEILLNLTLVNFDRKRFKLNSCLPPNLKLWQPLRSNPFDVAKSSFLGRAMPFYCRLSKLRAQAARHVSMSLEHFISLPVHEMSIDIPPSVYIRYNRRASDQSNMQRNFSPAQFSDRRNE